MKANSKVVGDVVTVQTALATGEVDIIVGGGEFAVSVLHEREPEPRLDAAESGRGPLEQAIGVFAASKKKELAVQFVKYIMSPEGQGTSRHLLLLLGHARQLQGHPHRRAEERSCAGTSSRSSSPIPIAT